MKKIIFSITLLLIFTLANSQSIIIKDKEITPNTLLEINDEGTSGSITFPSLSVDPGTVTSKLYNVGGILNWDGNPLITGNSTLWSLSGGDVFRSSGKVGIGTSSPALELDIISSQVDWASRIRLGNSDKTHTLFLNSGHSGQMPFISFSENDALLFNMYDGTSNELMRITSNGNVGIGTTNPLSKLSVGGDGDSNSTIFGLSDSNTGIGVKGHASKVVDSENYGGYFWSEGEAGKGVYGWATGQYGYGVYGRASTAGGINYGGYFEAAGEVGYGVYGFAGTFRDAENYGGYFESEGEYGYGVKGIANGPYGTGVEGWGNVAGTSYDFNAAGPGVNYGTTSSIRWKRNIIEIDNSLEKLSKLRGVYFDWDEGHGGHHDVGCIAEEVGKVLPEIVVYEENGIDADGMDYSKLTPLLVEAVKELKQIVEQQQKRIENLENILSKTPNL